MSDCLQENALNHGAKRPKTQVQVKFLRGEGEFKNLSILSFGSVWPFYNLILPKSQF